MTTHIGILDHDLFPEHPEFYAKYLLTNMKNGNVYTSIFGMNVLSLRRTELATKEDRANKLDYWAEVFRAETWEDLKRLAEKNRSVAEAMMQVSAEESARSILRARRKFEEVYTSAINGRARAEARLADAEERLAAQTAKLDAAVTERDAAVTERDVAFAERDAAVAERDAAQKALAEARTEMERLREHKSI